ncbi:MAG: cation:proton antiporter [Dehalococcoidia bacterium]|nr:cation:proton antiporter [Dehalococcoidia bacterium]
MEEGSLLVNIAVALALGFAGGYVARFIGIPVLVGYLIAGVVISPFTPGWNADVETIRQLSDIGIIFLMFGLGLNFDLKDLLRVKATAIPGALSLLGMLTLIGYGISLGFGLPWQEGVIIGLAMGIASSAVLSRGLIDHGLSDSIPGNIAIGWSVVEDLATVVLLALLPSVVADGDEGGLQEGFLAAGKAALFLLLMLVGGSQIIPFILRRVSGTGSRELFILGVVTCGLGIAAMAPLFEVSIALGAFIAGVVISETEMGHQATADVLPLRDAFAVLFFVAVGMLLDPQSVVDNPMLTGVILGAVVVGKSMLVLLLFALFPYSGRVALVVGAGLSQIGEFSFLIAQTTLDLGALSSDTYNVLLAAAVGSIAVNPLAFRIAGRADRWLRGTGPLWRYVDRQGPVPVTGAVRPNHVVVLGYGRVGELTGHALESLDIPFVIVEGDLERARRLSNAGFSVVWGDASNAAILEQASIEHASLLVAALPDEASTVLAVQHARRMAPNVPIIARARLRDELAMLRKSGVSEAVVPEYEGGLELMRQALTYLGYPDEEAERYRQAIRDIHYDAAAKQD